MPSFDIVKKNDLQQSFKVSKVMADFDVGEEHVGEHFVGKIDYPKDWQIGLIVGGSGTGKSTIAKELYKEHLVDDFEYPDKPVIESETLGCHPCVCTSSLKFNTRDILEKFLPAVHHTPIIVDMPEYDEE